MIFWSHWLKRFQTDQSAMQSHHLIRNCKSYCEKICKTTRELQPEKIKAAVSKKQLIFLEKCLTYNVNPKSLRIKPPIKSQKDTRITKKYRKKLLVLTKNDAKQRLRNYNIEVNDSSQELRSILSE